MRCGTQSRGNVVTDTRRYADGTLIMAFPLMRRRRLALYFLSLPIGHFEFNCVNCHRPRERYTKQIKHGSVTAM
jgi:hypothetical protein